MIPSEVQAFTADSASVKMPDDSLYSVPFYLAISAIYVQSMHVHVT
jgi:hypothetical protein